MSLKLHINLGVAGQKREVVWWKDLHLFPKIISHDGKIWEWQFYDKDRNGNYDYILHFTELRNYNNSMGIIPEPLDYLTGAGFNSNCECGALYERGFENIHSFWCPKWRKDG